MPTPPSFLSYLIARAGHSLSNTILSVAVGWHLYQLTGNPFDLALVGLVQVIPIIALFMVTGWVVDHFARRTILILCALVETGVLLGMAITMQQPTVNPQLIFTLLFVHGCACAFISPAQQAILPNLVDRSFLSQAVAITSTVWNLASTGGPVAAGLLIAWLDISTYWGLSALMLLTMLLFFRLPRQHHLTLTASPHSAASAQPHNEPPQKQLLAGVRFIQHNPYVLGSISLDLFVVLLGSVMALLPVYAMR